MIEIVRENYETPKYLQEILTNSLGRNFFGDPNFRLIWSGKRLDYIGGLFEDRDLEGNLIREVVEVRVEPKYENPVQNRWLIEGWLPAEQYGSPETWERTTQDNSGGKITYALGPYPSRGDYELSFVIEDPRTKQFVLPTSEIMRTFARKIHQSRAINSRDRLRLKYDMEAKKAAEYQSWAMDVLSPDATWMTPSGKSTIPHVYPYQSVSKTLTGRTL